MMTLLAYCPLCKKFFQVENVFSAHPDAVISNIKFIDSSTECPRGHVADIVDGVYDFINGQTVVQVDDPQVFRRLVEVATATLRGQIDPHAAVDLIKEIDPKVAGIFSAEFTTPQILFALLLFLTFASNVLRPSAEILNAIRTMFYNNVDAQQLVPQINITNSQVQIGNINEITNSTKQPTVKVTKEKIRKLKERKKKNEKQNKKKAKKQQPAYSRSN